VIHKANTARVSEIFHAAARIDGARASWPAASGRHYRGTFTLSNLGMYKVDAFSAIIRPRKAAGSGDWEHFRSCRALRRKTWHPADYDDDACERSSRGGRARAAEFLSDFGERHSRAREGVCSGCVHKVPWKGNEYFSRRVASGPHYDAAQAQ